MPNLIISIVFLYLATNLKSPRLLPYRDLEAPLIISTAIIGLLLIFYKKSGNQRTRLAATLLWISTIGVTAFGEYRFYMQRHQVQTADFSTSHQLQAIGAHLIVGYEKPNQIQELVRRGFIGGIYVGKRNAAGKTINELRDEIAALQSIRLTAGLPPLIVTADQEGGAVSHLSPTLPRQPALSTIAETHQTLEPLRHLALFSGIKQANALKSIGVNVNLSPVVDLKPTTPAGKMDQLTRIAERAISQDAEKVTAIALGYCKGLLSQGVTPTLKHFPGLASVPQDTHHFRARLLLPIEQLQQHDWRPFKEVTQKLPVFLMVGHVVVDYLDPDSPASQSAKVLTGLLRNEWDFHGILISDDMTMAAAYDTGLCKASIKSLNGGIDFLLVSYDWEKVYPVLTCLQQAYAAGTLKSLTESQKRISRHWTAISGQLRTQ